MIFLLSHLHQTSASTFRKKSGAVIYSSSQGLNVITDFRCTLDNCSQFNILSAIVLHYISCLLISLNFS